ETKGVVRPMVIGLVLLGRRLVVILVIFVVVRVGCRLGRRLILDRRGRRLAARRLGHVLWPPRIDTGQFQLAVPLHSTVSLPWVSGRECRVDSHSRGAVFAAMEQAGGRAEKSP